MNGHYVSQLLMLAPKEIREALEPVPIFEKNPELQALALYYACRTLVNIKSAASIVPKMRLDAQTIHSLIQLVAAEEFNSTTELISKIAKDQISKKAIAAARIRHSNEGGRTQQVARAKAEILSAWRSGKYKTKDICAEQECGGLGISFSTARKALRNA